MKLSKNGFTLIEVIVFLVLVGIMAVMVGMGFVRITQGFLFSKMNAATLQKGQMAMTRISQEINNIVSISSLSATTITFISYKKLISDVSTGGSIEKTRTIRLNGNKIEIDDGDEVFHTLTDQVANGDGLKFEKVEIGDPEKATIIVVTLKMVGADGVKQEFEARVMPRNM
jgi:prepilin-type N-terminal cleavage/methylation domain-containing protein